jgi:hypothetical protein
MVMSMGQTEAESNIVKLEEEPKKENESAEATLLTGTEFEACHKHFE